MLSAVDAKPAIQAPECGLTPGCSQVIASIVAELQQQSGGAGPQCGWPLSAACGSALGVLRARLVAAQSASYACDATCAAAMAFMDGHLDPVAVRPSTATPLVSSSDWTCTQDVTGAFDTNWNFPGWVESDSYMSCNPAPFTASDTTCVQERNYLFFWNSVGTCYTEYQDGYPQFQPGVTSSGGRAKCVTQSSNVFRGDAVFTMTDTNNNDYQDELTGPETTISDCEAE